MRLRSFERRFTYRLHEFYPETERRRYKRGLLGVAKGNGKSPFAGWLGAHELLCTECAPPAPRVLIGAGSLKQANWVFGDLRNAVTGPEGGRSPLYPFVEDFGLQILRRDGPGLAERVAAEAGTNDGARATCLIGDELHEWKDSRARVWLVLEGAVTKRRNAFALAISTAGADGDDSPLQEMYEHGKRVASGEVTDDEFLFEWYEAPAGLDLEDSEQWLAAVLAANPAAGDFLAIESIRSRFDGALRLPRHEFERYHLNRFSKADKVWEVAESWDALARAELELDPAVGLHVGIDVGIRHDSSAVVLAQQRDGAVVVRARVWENPWPATSARHDEWKFDIAEVREHLRALREAFPSPAIADGDLAGPGPAFYYDPSFFEESAQLLEGEGLNMIEYPQTDSRMVPASQTLFQVVAEGRLAHDGDPGLARHVKNVTPREKDRGFRISKPRGSRRKIDAAVAAAIAVHEATRLPPEPAEPDIRILEL